MRSLWSGLVFISLALISHQSHGQVLGKLGEMDRLEQQADDLVAQADSEGAALAIGKAAMMADLLTTESQKPAAKKIFQAAAFLFRSQELGFRALALFEQTGGSLPAPKGICHYLDQGHHKLTDSKKLLEGAFSEYPEDLNNRREKLLQETVEWEDLLLALHEDFACSEIFNKN